MKQEKWLLFENECANYLNNKYSAKTKCNFILSGGHDSHEPDLYVIKDSNTLFSMEIKMAQAQCGQFVLFPNDSSQSFAYSLKNKFPMNHYSKRIIEEMENNYFEYNTPSQKQLAFDKRLFYDWVKYHYQIERDTKYLISKGNDFVVFNIDNFEKYYDISAVFRIKKSGSANPSASDMKEILQLLEVGSVRFSDLKSDGRYVNVKLPDFQENKLIRTGGKYEYQFKRLNGDNFRITKLSNTYNANVIFSIDLLREQDPADLKEFEKDLGL